MTKTTSICVFCGSRSGVNTSFEAAGVELGQKIAANGWRLVYGAGDVGIMGAVAKATQDAGGETFGVIPQHLVDWEVGKTDLTTYIVTENMHERKKLMFMNSDAIVVLPGGAGSMDEFFEVLTWAQIGLHTKPIVLVNTDGYWTPLNGLIDHMIANGFADATLCDFYVSVDSVGQAFASLRDALSDDHE